MDLTAEHLAAIKDAAKGIRFGKITVSIADERSKYVDITTENKTRFYNSQAAPTKGGYSKQYQNDKY